MAQSCSILFSSRTTSVEDLMNLKKEEIVRYLRDRNKKISGNKHELAKRAYETHQIEVGLSDSVFTDTKSSDFPNSAPDYAELISGWTSDTSKLPKISVNDIERYLIHSSHRTSDTLKMECYRQYIRGLNFYKEQYIHKLMVNLITNDSKLCYIRSKCHPSMKKGTYSQWILMTKDAPFTILRGNCTCPAGLGEGCSHISGLLFAIEGLSGSSCDKSEETACTSKPCEWNKPSKRKNIPRPVSDIKFKRIKLNDINNDIDKACKSTNNSISEDILDSFRNKLCSRLGNNTNAVLFDLLPACENNILVESDLNVCTEVTVETTEIITYQSDKYININETVKQNNMSKSDLLEMMKDCDSAVIDELECRTRGQSENPLWVQSRKGRLTASIFHDVLIRKSTTPSKKLVDKIVCDSGENITLNVPALKWGRKMEIVAKKQYKAIKKLKFKENVKIVEQGLCIYKQYGFLGASPDGIVINNTEKYLIEVKCPYKWRFKSVTDACKDSDFCCYIDENNQIQLKQSCRYYAQVQGQMGICCIDKCDLVVFTTKDLKIVTVQFEPLYWEKLLKQLVQFYTEHVLPSLIKHT